MLRFCDHIIVLRGAPFLRGASASALHTVSLTLFWKGSPISRAVGTPQPGESNCLPFLMQSPFPTNPFHLQFFISAFLHGHKWVRTDSGNRFSVEITQICPQEDKLKSEICTK